MHKLVRRSLFTGLAVTVLLFNPVVADKNQKLLVVADTWCPFNCLSGTEEAGIMIELARLALNESGYDIDYQNLPWIRAAWLVKDGGAEAIVGMGKSKRTEEKYLFPRFPLAFTQVCFYTSSEADWIYKGVESLEGLRLGWINGYKFGDKNLDEWVEKHKDSVFVETVSGDRNLLERLIKMTQHNRVDVIAEVRSTVEYTLRRSKNTANLRIAGCLPQVDDVYIAFSKVETESDQYIAALDTGIERMLTKPDALLPLFEKYGLSLEQYLSGLEDAGLLF